MDIQEKIKQLDALKTEIEALGKLPDETLKKINYKFRLDWNYYSNQMEGGTLTKAETRSVMIDNIDVGGKPLKDIIEMKGHDSVILEIMRMGKGEVNISEKRIKELHTLIMYEEDPEKKTWVGDWKKEPNEIINYQDEKFQFTPVSEVKEAIHSLLNWLNAELDKIKAGKKGAMHPTLLAFEFHLRYLTIHPFYDGNGRTARILMNMILIRMGYPPVIIKTEKKSVYGKYLADIQCYGGDADLYYGFMLDLLQESLELVKNAIEGKNIDDADDLDKKLQLLRNKLLIQDEVQTKKTDDIVTNLVRELITGYTNSFKEILKVFEKFSDFFTETKISTNVNGFSYDPITQKDQLQEKVFEGNVNNMNISLELKGFKKAGIKTFNIYTYIIINFDEFTYTIYSQDVKDKEIKKLYHQLPSKEEMQELAQDIGNYIYETIERRIN